MGDSYIWVGPTSGSWTTASNWDDVTAGQNPASAPPGATSEVTINAASGGATQVITDSGVADSLSIDGDTELSGRLVVSTLNLSGGLLSLKAGATLSAATAIDLMSVPDAPGSLSIDGALTRLTSTGDFTIGGSATDAASQISVSNGGFLQVGAIRDSNDSIPSNMLINVDSNSAMIVGQLNGDYIAPGSLTVESGAFLQDTHTHITADTINIDGTLSGIGGSIDPVSGGTISTHILNVSGTVDGVDISADTINVSGDIRLYGNTITGAMIGNITSSFQIGYPGAGGAIVGSVNGGRITIQAGTTLDLTHALVSSNATIFFDNFVTRFNSDNNNLEIGPGSLDATKTLTVMDFISADSIFYYGNITGTSYWGGQDGGELTLLDGSAVVAQLTLQGENYAGQSFKVWNGGGISGITVSANPNPPTLHGAYDFDGLGQSDILWHDDNGQVSLWLHGQGADFQGQVIATVPTSTTLAGVADFNLDGKADLLWRAAGGDTVLWLSNGDPPANGFTTVDLGVVSTGWAIQKVGDFSGDGQQDILWRYTNGDVAIWQAKPGSGYTGFNGQDLGVVSPSWTIQAVGNFSDQIGDFNGDVKDDILWRNANGDISIWHPNSGVGFTGFTGQDLGVVSPSWTIQGVGDFSGGGKDDILWRNANGDVSIWHANSGAGYTGFTGEDLGIVSTSWHIQQVGDYNGDGKADILWRNTNGDISIWMSNSGAGYTGMTGHELGVVSTDWHIV